MVSSMSAEASELLQDLALEYKVITLPSFSIFQDCQLTEHYTGLESCRVMHSRLQPQDASQEDDTLGDAQSRH